MSVWEAHSALEEGQQFFFIEDEAQKREAFEKSKEVFLGLLERRLRLHFNEMNSRWKRLELRVDEEHVDAFERGLESAFTMLHEPESNQ